MELSREDVEGCRISRWYKIFEKDVPFKIKIIKLSKEFIEYLLQDKLYVPIGRYEDSLYDSSDLSEADADYITKSCSSVASSEDGKYPEFPEIEEEIEQAIKSLGGSVYPKLTWTAPKDGCWIKWGSNARCTTVGDVFLLLKGSDFIKHDILSAYEECVDVESDEIEPLNEKVNCEESLGSKIQPLKAPKISNHELILRSWTEIHPSEEFRLFVMGGKLIAISQRNTREYYGFPKNSIEIYKKMFVKFYESKFQKFKPKSIVIDVVVKPNERMVKLIDINPFAKYTDSLLFTWDEILSIPETTEKPVFRMVNCKEEAFYRTDTQYSTSMYPIEYVHSTSVEDFAIKAYQEQMIDDKNNVGTD